MVGWVLHALETKLTLLADGFLGYFIFTLPRFSLHFCLEKLLIHIAGEHNLIRKLEHSNIDSFPQNLCG